MASAELQELREAHRAEAKAKQTQVDPLSSASQYIDSTEYKCPLCNSMQTRYLNLGKRKDLQKGDTWGFADSATASLMVQVICARCRHTWVRRDDS